MTNNLLCAPFVRTSFGSRSFSVAAPKILNSPSGSSNVYQPWYLPPSTQDPLLPTGLPTHLVPLLLRLRFGFGWPLCAFINYIYLLTYILCALCTQGWLGWHIVSRCHEHYWKSGIAAEICPSGWLLILQRPHWYSDARRASTDAKYVAILYVHIASMFTMYFHVQRLLQHNQNNILFVDVLASQLRSLSGLTPSFCRQ